MRHSASIAALGFIIATAMAGARDLAPLNSNLRDSPSVQAFNLYLAWPKTAVRRRGRLLMAQQSASTGLRLQFGWRRLKLVEIIDGKRKVLGVAPSPRTDTLLVKRRGQRLFVYDKGRQLIAAESPLVGGRWGGDAKLAAAIRVQKVGDIHLDDDFMRDGNFEGAWRDPSDAFRVALNFDLERAVNPGCYIASCSEEAVAWAGHSFWDNYRAVVTVKRSSEEGELGLTIGNGAAGHALLWSGTELRLQSMTSPPVVLARKPIPMRQNQWFRLALTASDHELRAEVDGVELLRIEQPAVGGELGLVIRGGRALFDDVRVRPIAADKEVAAPAYGEFHRTDLFMRKWAVAELSATDRPVRDEYFLSQAANWIALDGTWRSFPRWSCLSAHSFFGAPPQTQAISWYKQRLAGDFAIDLFVATPMYAYRTPFYNYPVNVQALVHHTEGEEESGYRFVYGSFDIPSAILCNGRLLASDDRLTQKDIRMKKNEFFQKLHKRWVHLQLVRESGRVRLIADGEILVEAEDTAQLPGGWLGVGSWQNGLSMARARISAETIADNIAPDATLYEYRLSDGALGRQLPKLRTRPELAQPDQPQQLAPGTHDGTRWHTDFGQGWPRWMIMVGPDGGQPSGVMEPKFGRCLRLANKSFGGAMAVWLWDGKLKTAQKPVLSFVHRIPDWVHLNVMCMLADRSWVEVLLTDHNRAMFKRVGTASAEALPGHPPSSGWRRSTLDLAALLGPDVEVQRIMLADAGYNSGSIGDFYDLASVEMRAESALPNPDALVPTTARSEVTAPSVLYAEDFEGLLPHTNNLSTRTSPRFASWRSGAIIPMSADDETNQVLHVVAREYGGKAGTIGVYDQSFEVERHPMLSFAHRGPAEKTFVVVIVNDERISLGEVPLNTDGEWHDVTVDLVARLQERQRPTKEVLVSDVLLSTRFQYETASWLEIDNVRLAARVE